MNTSLPHSIGSSMTDRNDVRRATLLLLVALPLLCLYLALRNRGLFPSIMGDEWTYSSSARLMPLADVPLPSYLYFALFGFTDACGSGFLSCARLFNVVLFVASAPFIYAVARRLVPALPAAGLALLALLGPINAYTAFFMPEASYFLGFWVLTWCAMRFAARPDMAGALAIGTALGLMSLIKVHALFLLPAIALFMLYAAWRGAPGLARGVLLLAVAVAVAATLRFGLGYLLAGPNAFSLMGKLYQEQSAYSAQMRKPLGLLLELSAGNLSGHIMALALLFGMPLAALAASALRERRGAGLERGDPVVAFTVYTALVLASMVAVTVLFTASVAGNGPSETIHRLHLRYYDFALPLLPLFAAAQLYRPAPPRLARIAFGLLLAAVMIAAVFLLPMHFEPSYVDGPELRGMASKPVTMYLLTLVGLAAVATWMVRPQAGARLFVTGFLPLFTLIAAVLVNRDVRRVQVPDAYDQAGIFAQAHLDSAARARMAFVGSDPGGLFKARFHLDALDSRMVPTTPGTAPDLSQLGDARWLLVVGDYPPPPYAVPRARKGDVTVLEVLEPAQAQRLDFRAPLDNTLAAMTGLGVAESWGRWSSGTTIDLRFRQALPPRMTLRLTGRAFGPNAGQPVRVRVGDQERILRLPESWQTSALQFDNTGGETTIVIVVPQPVSPRTLGLGEDGRELGIALVSLDIGTLPAAENRPTRLTKNEQQEASHDDR